MKPLYTQAEFNTSKSRDKLPLECLGCGKTILVIKKTIVGIQHQTIHNTGDFCSSRCQRHHESPPVIVTCKQCGKSSKKHPSETKKSPNHFCCVSCSARWNNIHKTHGTTVSRLEKWLQERLFVLFPGLEFHFNHKDAINGELDIFIPSLRLAFELNGVFHYEPIHGPEKLGQIQTNDHRKMLACAERGIELCVIDVSSMTHFKPVKAQKFLDIIVGLIRSKLSGNLPVSLPLPS